MRIKLYKIEEREDAMHPNNIQVGIEKYGEALSPPVVGECFYLQYHPKVHSYFRTSTVTEIIDHNTFKTLNSVYRIEYI